MTFRERWTYDGSEPEILLFTHCLQAWGFDIQPGDRILELGCCETDFARRLKAAVPDLHVTGIDVRNDGQFGGDVLIQADAGNPDILKNAQLPVGSFDWVISLGAIEHFGLGWYGDPESPIADRNAVFNALHFLKPGGSLYFDVPWTPAEHYETKHWRCYSDASWRDRLGNQPGALVTWRARGWVPNERERDDYTQVRPMVVHPPFYFVANWGVKA